MKKLLSLLAAFGLTATAGAGVIACGTSDSSDSIAPTATWKDGTTTLIAKNVELPEGADASKLFTLTTNGEDTTSAIKSAKFEAPVKALADANGDGSKTNDQPAKKNVKGTLTVEITQAAPEKTTKYNYVLTGKDDAKSISIKFSVEVKGTQEPSNKDVTISKAVTTNGKTITLTTTALVVKADKADFTLSGTDATVSSVSGDVNATTVTLTLSKAIAKTDKVSVKAYATASIDIDTTGMPDAKPTDNSKVEISNAKTTDGTTITLTSTALVLKADAKDFTLSGTDAKVKSASGEKGATSITLTLDKAIAKKDTVTIAAYASKDVKVDTTGMPNPITDNSKINLGEAKLGDDLQTVTITASANLVKAVEAGDITISGATTDGINGVAVTDVKAAAGQNTISFKLAVAAAKGTDGTITITINGFASGHNTATVTVPAE